MFPSGPKTFFGSPVFFILFLFIITCETSASASVQVENSHRVIPGGQYPDQELVNQEGGVWTFFTGDIPMLPVVPDTALHQVSDRVFRRFSPWDWSESYEVDFLDEDGVSTTAVAVPGPAFPFDPSAHGVPVIHLGTPPENLWDPEIGLYVWGNHINFDQGGAEWERPATMDYYDPDGSLVFSEPIGLRIHGGLSRFEAQKGFRIYFDDYGNSNEMNFDFFGSEPTSLRRLILRDNLYTADWLHSNLAETLFAGLGHLVSRYTLVHAYLNDEYWGTFSLRDRVDDEFFEHSLGYEGTDYILLKDGEEEHGDSQLWYDFLNSFSEPTSLNAHDWFVSLNDQMDLETFIDWLFINIFGATTDNGFRHNVIIFRLEGGKWTHLMWDEDLLFFPENLYSNHFRFYAAENEAEFDEFNPPRSHWLWDYEIPTHCAMFNRMMNNSEFKALFSARVDELLDGPMSIAGWTEKLNDLIAIQSPEVPAHAERWSWSSPNSYFVRVNNILEWIETRHPVIVDQKNEFMDHFRVPVELTDFTTEMEGGAVKLTWVTQSEENCQGFVLSRSIGTPDNMVPIASHEFNPDLVGSGGIWQTAQYEFYDLAPVAQQLNYYQLLYTDSNSGQDVALEWINSVWPSGWGGLELNELMADNVSDTADEFGEFDDWFEIVNTSDHSIPLLGLYFSDSFEDPLQFQYTGTTILAPGEYATFWADDSPEQGSHHCTFKLGSGGEEISVYAPDGTTQISSVSFGPQLENISFARFPDGLGSWSHSTNPSFGAENPAPEIETLLKINELMADNSTTVSDGSGDYDPWVEIYNPLPAPNAMSGLFLSNQTGTPQHWPLPDLEVPGNGYFLIWADGEPDEGPAHASFLLSPDDGHLILSGPTGVIDEVQFDSQPSDVSYGCQPDGSSNWVVTDSPTPGSANPAASQVRELLVNEFLASNDSGHQDETGAFEDWLEIYNPGDTGVPLAGLFLSDDQNQPLTWPLPDITIPAGDFILVYCDDDPDDGPLHATFKLSASGEDISLYDADALQFCDIHSFGEQVTDVSEGRQWDGDSTWISFITPTPGHSNGTPPSNVPDPLVSRTAVLKTYPNPFNPQTSVVFRLAHDNLVRISVHDIRGRLVKELQAGPLQAGQHTVIWNGQDEWGHQMGSGAYFVRLKTPEVASTHRIMLIK